MTTLQDTAVGPASQDEPRAPIAILSPAKRNALVACFNAGGLHKKDGAWHGLPGGKPVSGMTTADLARDEIVALKGAVSRLQKTMEQLQAVQKSAGDKKPESK
jgi:hypothetical protein